MVNAYGRQHQRMRLALLNRLPGLMNVMEPSPRGCLCPRCGKPMKSPPEPLDCGHTSEQAKLAGLPGDRLEHATCNREAGASRAIRPGSGYQPSEEW